MFRKVWSWLTKWKRKGPFDHLEYRPTYNMRAGISLRPAYNIPYKFEMLPDTGADLFEHRDILIGRFVQGKPVEVPDVRTDIVKREFAANIQEARIANVRKYRKRKKTVYLVTLDRIIWSAACIQYPTITYVFESDVNLNKVFWLH
jgi:hypothetical protein